MEGREGGVRIEVVNGVRLLHEALVRLAVFAFGCEEKNVPKWERSQGSKEVAWRFARCGLWGQTERVRVG